MKFNTWELNFIIDIKSRIECGFNISKAQIDKLRLIIISGENKLKYNSNE